MLIKITLILIVISIALYVIAKMYFRALSAGSKLRLTCTTNYTVGKRYYLWLLGLLT